MSDGPADNVHRLKPRLVQTSPEFNAVGKDSGMTKLERIARALQVAGDRYLDEHPREGWEDIPMDVFAQAAIAEMEAEMVPEAWLIPESCAVIADAERAATLLAEGRIVIPLYQGAALKEWE